MDKKNEIVSKYRVGYTQGTYDMFHIGHLNLLNNAKKRCDYLIVGVNSNRLVQQYKKKDPMIDETERCKIVCNIKAVDEAVIVDTLDKMEILKSIHFDAIFIGDDWKGNKRWEDTRKALSQQNVDVVFLPYTPDISSSILREKIAK